MEGSAAEEILKKSVIKNQLVYSPYVGDGDTSSIKNLFKSDPNGELKQLVRRGVLDTFKSGSRSI